MTLVSGEAERIVRAAVESIVTRSAGEHISAGVAEQHVVTRIAGQSVSAVAAQQ